MVNFPYYSHTIPILIPLNKLFFSPGFFKSKFVGLDGLPFWMLILDHDNPLLLGFEIPNRQPTSLCSSQRLVGFRVIDRVSGLLFSTILWISTATPDLHVVFCHVFQGSSIHVCIPTILQHSSSPIIAPYVLRLTFWPNNWSIHLCVTDLNWTNI